MDVLIASEVLFSNFINKNNIILDNDYETIKNYYKYNFLDIKRTDKNYYHLKDDINLIYYIIIIYYFDKKNLLDFIRFYTSKINFYDLNSKKIVKYSKIINKSKLELVKYLKDNIDVDKKNFYLFIYCIQNYI